MTESAQERRKREQNEFREYRELNAINAEEQPHVSNPIRYLNKVMQVLKENIKDCNNYDFTLHIGLANRFIEDAFWGKQINEEELKTRYGDLSKIFDDFNKKCECSCVDKGKIKSMIKQKELN